MEAELGLRDARIPPDGLGSIDTFRFEERALLAHCGDLIAEKQFDQALAIISGREHSFWLDRDVGRKAQGEACRRMAELGCLCVGVRGAVSKADGDANTWIDAYTSKDGWFRLDQAQRRLEAWVANLDDDPQERPLGVVRSAYEDACRAMADGFQTGHLFAPMPDIIRDDMAFIDRLHFYLPGWEIPQMRNELFTDHYGFVVDYLAEALREMRKHNFTEIIDRHFSMGVHLNARDRKAVRKTVSGLMKILFPHGDVTQEELAEILEFALEGRRRVKEQLKKMGSFEYYQTSFSYTLQETRRRARRSLLVCRSKAVVT